MVQTSDAGAPSGNFLLLTERDPPKQLQTTPRRSELYYAVLIEEPLNTAFYSRQEALAGVLSLGRPPKQNHWGTSNHRRRTVAY